MSDLRLVRDGEENTPAGPLRVLFCGSREFTDRDIIRMAVHGANSVATMLGRPLVVIEGEARGADQRARVEAEDLGVEVRRFPADWDQHGKAAGAIRNRQMLKEGQPHCVLAFADDIKNSKGTRDMCSIADAAGVPAYIISRYQGDA
jgi:hypothetical protein